MSASGVLDPLARLHGSGEWYSPADIAPEDIAQIARLLERGTISVISGGMLAQFERQFAQFAGVANACAVNSGTSALYAALWAHGVRAGDDVLICDYGFHGMAAAVLAIGARVVPVDCDSNLLTMDPADLARARTPQSRAVLVHCPWGVPAEMHAIRRAVPDLPLIVDASHAHGATYAGGGVAQAADTACYSLGHSKLITGGELGCVVTADTEVRDRVLLLGHVNRVPNDLKVLPWTGNSVGLKLRPHALALALALPQIRRFPARLESLRQTCGAIEALFAGFGVLPQAVPEGSQRAYWKIVLSVPHRLEPLIVALREHGVPVEANHYEPLLQHQSIFNWPEHERLVLRRDCPVAQATTSRLLTLPAPVHLSEESMGAVRRALESWSSQGD
jgi:dTDP-4-amino-4,6-dideoxygalactose transaminase